MCNDAIAYTIAHCKYRPHFAGTVLNPLTSNSRIVLFTPDLRTPHKAFPSLPATVLVFWNDSTHFCILLCVLRRCLVHMMPPQSTKIKLLPRRVRHFVRTVPGRYLLSYQTVNHWCQKRHHDCQSSTQIRCKYVLLWWDLFNGFKPADFWSCEVTSAASLDSAATIPVVKGHHVT